MSEEFSIGDVERLCPAVSRDMVRTILNSLRCQKRLTVQKRGRYSIWRNWVMSSAIRCQAARPPLSVTRGAREIIREKTKEGSPMRGDSAGHLGFALKVGFPFSRSFERKTRKTFRSNQRPMRGRFSYGSKTGEVAYFRSDRDSIIMDRPVFTAENKE